MPCPRCWAAGSKKVSAWKLAHRISGVRRRSLEPSFTHFPFNWTGDGGGASGTEGGRHSGSETVRVPPTRIGPSHKTTGYCWRIPPTVIWPAFVAQEGTSKADGEARIGGRGRCPNSTSWRFNWGSPTVSDRLLASSRQSHSNFPQALTVEGLSRSARYIPPLEIKSFVSRSRARQEAPGGKRGRSAWAIPSGQNVWLRRRRPC